MNEHDVAPLDMDLRDLLEAERQRPDPPDEMRRRVRAGVLAAAAAAPLAASAAAAPTTSVVARLLAHPLRLIIATAAIGTVTVVALQLADDPAPASRGGVEAIPPATPTVPVPTAPTPAPAPAVVPTAPAAVQEVPEAPAAHVKPRARVARKTLAPPSPAPAVEPPAPQPSKVDGEGDSALAVERAMLERTRRALARGRPAEALRIAAMHERRYPSGHLAEERERLRIQALLDTGDRPGARARAEAFRRRFPKSIFLPAIEAALGLP